MGHNQYIDNSELYSRRRRKPDISKCEILFYLFCNFISFHVLNPFSNYSGDGTLGYKSALGKRFGAHLR